MIAQFKPAGRLTLFGSMAAVAVVGLIAFTRAAERPRPQGETLVDDPAHRAIHGEATPLAVDPASPEMQRLAQQLADLNKQVKRQEEKVLDLRSAMQETDSNIRNPASANEAIAATILQLNALKVQLGNDAFKEEVLLKQLDKLDADRAGTTTTRIISDPILTQLVQEKLATDARLASLQSDKGAEHPEVKQAAAVRKRLQAQIADQLDAIKAVQLAKIESLHAQLDNTQKQLNMASENASQAAARNGELQLTLKKQALENAMKELQELKLQFQEAQKQTEMQRGRANKVEDDWSSSSTQKLTIEADGTMKFGSSAESISLEQLKSALTREREKDPNTSLTIKADPSTSSQRVLEIFDAAKKAGIKAISLKTGSTLQ